MQSKFELMRNNRLRAKMRARSVGRGLDDNLAVIQRAVRAEPQPVEPKDEADELRRQFIESTRALTKMAERIEQLERPALRSAA